MGLAIAKAATPLTIRSKAASPEICQSTPRTGASTRERGTWMAEVQFVEPERRNATSTGVPEANLASERMVVMKYLIAPSGPSPAS